TKYKLQQSYTTNTLSIGVQLHLQKMYALIIVSPNKNLVSIVQTISNLFYIKMLYYFAHFESEQNNTNFEILSE
ncbi:MAG: hypothetical protein ACR2LR_14825, partial [Hassallia sp.]